MSDPETCPRVSSPALPVLSVSVMAHPSRAVMVEELLTRLGYPAAVAWDEKNDEWHTARRALLAYGPAAEYHLVVQDDALLCRALWDGLTAALPHAPAGAVVSLYAGETRRGAFWRAHTAAAGGTSSWLLTSRLWWGVAAAYPVEILDRLVAGCDTSAVREYDRRVSTWLRRKGVAVAYTVPSLVDHADGPSLLHHDGTAPGTRARRAPWFIGEDASPLDVDWTLPPLLVSDPRAPAQQVRRVSNRPTVRRR